MQPRVILALATETDAESVWDRIKAFPMFAAGPLVKFGFFGREGAGQVRPYIATCWATNAADLAALVDHGRAGCVCGCYVQVGDILEQALREPEPVVVVAIIGDSFHGDLDAAIATARQLRARGTSVVFLSRQPNDAFTRIAVAAGGTVLSLPPRPVERIAQRLPEGLEAVAHFATGDAKALEALGTEPAALLLEQIKRGKSFK
jgi:hypothetical protein